MTTYEDDDLVCGVCGKSGVETQPDADGDRYHYVCLKELFAEVGEAVPAGWEARR